MNRPSSNAQVVTPRVLPQLAKMPAREIAPLLAHGTVTVHEVNASVSSAVACCVLSLCGRAS